MLIDGRRGRSVRPKKVPNLRIKSVVIKDATLWINSASHKMMKRSYKLWGPLVLNNIVISDSMDDLLLDVAKLAASVFMHRDMIV